jgi:hypothetical protein
MKTVFFLFCILFSNYGFTQSEEVNVENSGRMSTGNMNVQRNGLVSAPVKYYKVVSGSEYFNDNWLLGDVFFPDGGSATNQLLKINLIDKELYYFQDGNEYLATSPFLKVTLKDTVKKQSYTFYHHTAIDDSLSVLPKTWIQELADAGKFQFYVHFEKSHTDFTPFMSSLAERKINTEKVYYVAYNGTIQKIKKFKKVTEVLPYLKGLEEFIEQNKLTGKKDEDYLKLANWLSGQ